MCSTSETMEQNELIINFYHAFCWSSTEYKKHRRKSIYRQLSQEAGPSRGIGWLRRRGKGQSSWMRWHGGQNERNMQYNEEHLRVGVERDPEVMRSNHLSLCLNQNQNPFHAGPVYLPHSRNELQPH